MEQRRYRPVVVLMFVIALLAAACSSSSDTTTTSSDDAAATTSATATTSSSEGTASPSTTGASERTTVRMVLWPGPEGDAMSVVVDDYNANQGADDGVTVEMILLSRDDTFAREQTEIAAGSDAVDIYFVASYNVGQLSVGLEPLGDIGLDTADYFPAALDSLKVDGEQYGLPLDISNHFLYYRTDLIDELLSNTEWQDTYRTIAQAAIGEARDPKHPDEWDVDDYIAAAAFFTQSVNPDSPTKFGTFLQAKANPFNALLWDDILWGVGGSWTQSGAGETANLTTPEAARAVDVYRTIYENGYTDPSSSQGEYGEANAAFQGGAAAFIHQWSAAFSSLDDSEQSPDTAGKVGIAPPPGNPHSTHVHALAIAVNAQSKNKDAARVWMSYLATPEAMDKYAKAGGIPSMPQVLADNVALNAAFAAISEQVAEYGYSPYIFEGTFPTMEDLGATLSGAWVGIDETDGALADVNGRLQERLDASGG